MASEFHGQRMHMQVKLFLHIGYLYIRSEFMMLFRSASRTP